MHCFLSLPCEPWVCSFAVLEASSHSRTWAASPFFIMSPKIVGVAVPPVCTAAACRKVGAVTAHPWAGHIRGGGFKAMFFPHVAPNLSCSRAMWPPASVMVTREVCCWCWFLWRTLESPAWECSSFAPHCVPLLLLQFFFSVLLCAGGKGKGKEKGKGWVLRQHIDWSKLINFHYVWMGWGCRLRPCTWLCLPSAHQDPSRFPPDAPVVVAVLATPGSAAGDWVLELFPWIAKQGNFVIMPIAWFVLKFIDVLGFCVVTFVFFFN